MNKQVKFLLVERKPRPNLKLIVIGDKKFLLIGSGLAKFDETIHSLCYREDDHREPPYDYFSVDRSFAIEDRWLHVEASATLKNGPFGVYGKLCVWYDGKQVGDFKIYKGTIGGGTSGTYPYIVDRDLHIVFWYDLLPRKHGTCSIELYRAVIVDHDYLKSTILNKESYGHDLTFKPYKLSQLDKVKKLLWFYPIFDDVMNKELGTLRLYEYPGFTQYKYCIENDYSFLGELPSLTTIEKIETRNVLRVLEFESKEGTESEIVSEMQYKTISKEEYIKRVAVI